MPYGELKGLDINRKVSKILKSVKQDRILFIDGKLHAIEESELIRRTMEEIDRKFKGIEICSLDGFAENKDMIAKLKAYFANALFGLNTGFTVVGPASIIKEIRKDPTKMELLTFESKKYKRRK